MHSTPPPVVSIPTHNTVSIDGMGYEQGESTFIHGLHQAYNDNPDIHFIVHGNTTILSPLIDKHYPNLNNRCTWKHTEHIISQYDKPKTALRNSKGTSMWHTLDTVRTGNAAVAVSGGNTGALMTLSVFILRKAPGVVRPALACLWPAPKNKNGFTIMLDAGADVKANAEQLQQYALMGATYAKCLFNFAKPPRIGLLNVGTEWHKGNETLTAADALIKAQETPNNYTYLGFIEGHDIISGHADVIVTDGFTGNVTLKTAEEIGSQIRTMLRDIFMHSLSGQLSALLVRKPLRTIVNKIDGRNVNGGVFLGLNGQVVKSHGAADARAIASSINTACRLVQFYKTDKAPLSQTKTHRNTVHVSAAVQS